MNEDASPLGELLEGIIGVSIDDFLPLQRLIRLFSNGGIHDSAQRVWQRKIYFLNHFEFCLYVYFLGLGFVAIVSTKARVITMEGFCALTFLLSCSSPAVDGLDCLRCKYLLCTTEPLRCESAFVYRVSPVRNWPKVVGMMAN